MYKILSVFIAVVLFSNTSIVDAANSQDELRTLFTTSSTRHKLDTLREQGKFKNANGQSSAPIFREPLIVKMQGVVIRKGKKPVIFANDNNTLTSQKVTDDIRINPKRLKKKSYKISVSVNQQYIKLKPGQQWDESKRQVQDTYQIKASKNKTTETDSISKAADNK